MWVNRLQQQHVEVDLNDEIDDQSSATTGDFLSSEEDTSSVGVDRLQQQHVEDEESDDESSATTADFINSEEDTNSSLVIKESESKKSFTY